MSGGPNLMWSAEGAVLRQGTHVGLRELLVLRGFLERSNASTGQHCTGQQSKEGYRS
jgi:hypothetical protein